MEIKGKVHCFFEQSGTFKNEFKKLGIPAEDYDIQDNFGQTDHVVDLFSHIEREYDKTRQDKTRQDKTRQDDIRRYFKGRLDHRLFPLHLFLLPFANGDVINGRK